MARPPSLAALRVASRYRQAVVDAARKKALAATKGLLARALAKLVKGLMPALRKLHPMDWEEGKASVSITRGYVRSPDKIVVAQSLTTDDAGYIDVRMSALVGDEGTTPQPARVEYYRDHKLVEEQDFEHIDVQGVLSLVRPHLETAIGPQTLVWWGYVSGSGDDDTWVVGLSQKQVMNWADNAAQGMREDSKNNAVQTRMLEVKGEARERLQKAYDAWKDENPGASEDEAEAAYLKFAEESEIWVEAQRREVEQSEEGDDYMADAMRFRIDDLFPNRPLSAKGKERIIAELTKSPHELIGG